LNKLSDRINLKEIERRAYLSYHGDGLADILVGICHLQLQSFKEQYPLFEEN